jgi:hypothetical protein
MTSFVGNLSFGHIAECQISRFLIKKNWGVIPAYEKLLKDQKGPRIFPSFQKEPYISPDLLIYKGQEVYWAECKNKTGVPYNRHRSIFTTGIDKVHFENYLKVDKETPWKVYVFFLHGDEVLEGTPEGCVPPSGLFTQWIGNLKLTINHECEKNAMIYWDCSVLIKLCNLKEFMEKIC